MISTGRIERLAQHLSSNDVAGTAVMEAVDLTTTTHSVSAFIIFYRCKAHP
jgi:hypothetical protein